MPKKYSETPIIETRDAAKQMIDEGNIEFYMRTKAQENYNPQRITFSSQQDKIAYTLRDMAGLCTSEEVAYYISEIARKITYRNPELNTYNISEEDLEYAIKFIRTSKSKYKKAKYIDLSKIQ